MGTREMPLWILDKILEYPNAYDIKVATETECSMYWKQLMSDNVPENPSGGSTWQGRQAATSEPEGAIKPIMDDGAGAAIDDATDMDGERLKLF
ncbi:hypothetical protein BKA82DRAFT_36412 [Pisolithus tinctorius]|nr:hypothetical protein BKA82DRAFT_36412 [Pisolithus tinctorius]